MVLRLRGAVMPDEFRQRVLRCPDPDLVRHWLARAVVAGSPGDVFDDDDADEDGFETSQRLRAEGRTSGRAENILLVLRARGISVDEGIQERVTACTDLETLESWLSRAATAERAEDVFDA